MSNWENRFKNRLESSGWEVPEGDWEVLQTRRAAWARKRTWRKAALWTAPAAAAALALLLVLPPWGAAPAAAPQDEEAVFQNGPVAEAAGQGMGLEQDEAGAGAGVVGLTALKCIPVLSREDSPEPPPASQDEEDTPRDEGTVRDTAQIGIPDGKKVTRAKAPLGKAGGIEGALRTEGRFASTRPDRKVSIEAGGLLAALYKDTPRGMPMMDALSAPYSSSLTGSQTGTGRVPDLRRIAAIAVAPDQLIGTRHLRPLEFGLTAGFPLGERWTLVSGLEYALYRSQFSYTLSGSQNQRAHYLGVPLLIHFNVINQKDIRLYLGAGAKADWGIATRRGGERLHPDGFGFTLQAVSGFQWNMTPSLGLYLEPRYGWFLSGTDGRVQTFRTESPRLFSLSAGLQLHL
ncbi:MAG: PorT family protein [Bacteroidales bacterium]|nr:PorT family protein [Bacteroidales bacterium]